MKVLHYSPPQPDPSYATPEQLKGMNSFAAWRAQLCECKTFSDAWVRLFLTMAGKQAEKEEEAARIAATIKFAAWLREGPAQGLRRQHRYSRNADGWCETQMAEGEENDITERDDLDGISEQQLAAVKGTGQSACRTPAEAQQEANICAKVWSKQWGSELKDIEELEWPEHIGESPPALWVEAVLDAAMTFPADTGLGWDGIHPRCLHRVSRELIEWLVLILRQAEATGEWQAAVELVIIVLLPKPDGGFRPIGLLPFLPRLWMRVRKEACVKWGRPNQIP